MILNILVYFEVGAAFSGELGKMSCRGLFQLKLFYDFVISYGYKGARMNYFLTSIAEWALLRM